MAYTIHDRWIWLGFGVVLYLAAQGIRGCMVELVQDTAIDIPADPTKEDQNTEPEDCKTLLLHNASNPSNTAQP